MTNTIIFGNGFVASHLNYPIVKDRLEPNATQIRSLLNLYKPDTVINAIGYAGNKNIDDCENNKDKTILANLSIPTILATECYKLGIHLIHIGSGCIYYGASPNITTDVKYSENDLNNCWIDLGWKETDFAHPLSFYSQTKYACDLAISNLPNTCILRIRMPISDKHSPRNLITKLLRYENVLKMPNSVSFLSDISRLVDWVIQNNKTGIYNATNSEPLTHIDLLEEYRKYRPEHKYNTINVQELGNYIKSARSNCILSTQKLNSEGFYFTPTLEALEQTMKNYIVGK